MAMRMYDIIDKKKKGSELTPKEITYMVEGYVAGEIPDYQVSAFLMAVYYEGMSEKELSVFTDSMAKSGDMVDLSQIKGIKVDKHSTGGVGDKTTLAVAPLVAACGGRVAKMSGRGLGFTGGTIDKLESIPDMQTAISEERFFEIVNDIGLSVIGQSAEIAPADKKLYALRDVTATVDSIPLIAASIMSKKLASGSDKIVLDVTVGSGAFMKNIDDAQQLAELMVQVGKNAGKRCRAIITDMNEPLGNAIGNSLEVIEVCEILSGREKGKLYELCIALAANMMELGGLGSLEDCTRLAEDAITSGRAIDTFKKMIEAQGGNPNITEDYSLFKRAAYKCELKAEKSGYISSIDSEKIGMVALLTGAGRRNKNDNIDSSAGIILNKHVGDCVDQGDVIMTFYSSVVKNFDEVINKAADAVEISGIMPKISPVVIKII